jgi:hypothetical protein
VNEYGIIASSGVTKTTSAPAPDLWQAPSNYICHDELPMIVANTSSSGRSSSMGKSSGIGCAARKLARAWPFIAFCGINTMSNCDRNMAHLAILLDNDILLKM